MTPDTNLLNDTYLVYVVMEDEAESLKIYSGDVIPGLLQTSAYAQALATTPAGVSSLEETDALYQQAYEMRMHRQQKIMKRMQDGEVQISVLLDESVFYRPVEPNGGTEVLRDQIKHLVHLMETYPIELGVIPFAAGVHRGIRGSFNIVDTKNASAVYVESGPLIKEAETMHLLVLPRDIEAYRSAFLKMREDIYPGIKTETFMRIRAAMLS